MAACRSCKSKSLIIDDVTGDTVCSNCGIVQDFENYQHQFGGISGPQGTFVRLGTSGSGTDYSYKERKLFEANRVIEDIAFRFNFTDARTREVKDMVEKVTEGEFGLGDWFSVLVGACSYIVMRQNNKSLPISEVIGVVECELYEMGKMVNRVVNFLGLELPEFNVVGLLERTIRGFSGFREVDKEKVDLMIKQGIFVIQCAVKWFLTTGRRPGPVAVAVLVFVAAVNGIKIPIEDVAREMNVAIRTCRMRYKELLETLVDVARGLPWGKDINVKNIVKNAPFVMKYMEMKSMENTKTKKRKRCGDESDRFDLKKVVVECLSGEVEYETNGDGNSLENSLGCYYEVQDRNDALELSTNDLENIKVSHETLAKIYSKFKFDITNRDTMNGSEVDLYRDKLSGKDFRLFDEWWSGRSELCQKLVLQKILETDVGLDPLPPSYIRGCLAIKRRREKIRAAKKRISSIICSTNDIPNDENVYNGTEICTLDSDNGHKKKSKQYDSIDWEDFIIETLLLHQVKEDEIEKGHYNALLGLHVFKSGLF